MKRFFSILALLLLSVCSVQGQPQLNLSISTGDDDLREGSKVNITVIFFNPARGVILKEVAAGRRFPDRTTFTASIALPAGMLASNIQEVQLEYIPDPSHNFTQEPDKWWFTRFLVVYQNGDALTNIYENNSVGHKFEARGNWSTGVLPSFVMAAPVKKIIVTNTDNGAPAANAQVFLKLNAASGWTSMGMTNSAGEIVFTQNITTASVLIARQKIHEQNYYRSRHDWNSTQNWNYRVYLTNLDVQNNGVMLPNVSGLGTNTINLHIRKRNALIGCNLLACAEWDLNAAEINTYKSRLKGASDYLFNATDGQFYFEQITMFDQSNHWDDCDYRIHSSSTLRANTPYPTGAFLGQDVWGSCMHLAMTDDEKVYAHEFGHYGFDLKDEYEDNNPNKVCTPSVLNPGSMFGSDAAVASCMMWYQWSTSKLCSSIPSNPHIDGTSQGSQSCWSKLLSRYNWSANWRLTSPEDKGAVVPTMVMPDGSAFSSLPFLNTAFNMQTTDAAGLLGTHTIRTETASGGAPLENVEISNFSPAFTFLGTTGSGGTLSITGAHSGDQVLAMHPSGEGALATIAPGTTQTVIPLNITIEASGSPRPLVMATPRQNIQRATANARVTIAPAAGGYLSISIKPVQKLKANPVVSFIGDGRKIPLRLQGSGSSPDSMTFTMGTSPGVTTGYILISGDNEDNSLLRQVIPFTANRQCPEEIMAFDGNIRINKGGKMLSKGQAILYNTRTGIDKLPAGTRTVGLPFVLKTSDPDFYSGSTMLEARLPTGFRGAVAKTLKTQTLQLCRYDIIKQTWIPQNNFLYNKYVAVFAGPINSDGIYAVIVSK